MISNDTFKAIAALDFTQITLKLMDKTSGEGWSQAQANATEAEYRRFLYLHSAFPEAAIAPTLDVDKFWHYHILDTMKYATDCEQVFGYFLHHYPYVGLLDDDEPSAKVVAGERTRALYEATFGEPYPGAQAYTQGDGQASATKYQDSGALGEALEGTSPAWCEEVGASTAWMAKGGRTARCQAICGVWGPHAQMRPGASAHPGSRHSHGNA